MALSEKQELEIIETFAQSMQAYHKKDKKALPYSVPLKLSDSEVVPMKCSRAKKNFWRVLHGTLNRRISIPQDSGNEYQW